MSLQEITQDPLWKYDQLKTSSQSMTWSTLATAQSFLLKLREDINIESNSPNIRDNWPEQMEGVVTMDTTPPSAPALPEAAPVVPVAPVLAEIEIERFTMPEFTVLDPQINIPEDPVLSWPTDPGSAPSLDDVTTPIAPSYTLPTVPTFEDIALPTAPDLEDVRFDGIRPDVTIDAPGNLFVFEEQPYSSDVRDALVEKVLADIRNGGTGLGAEVEQAIWDRARNRMREDRQQALDEIRNKYAASGCSRPSGPMAAAEARVDREYGRKLSDLDRDILVQQSELAQKNTQQALDLSVRLEQISVDLHNKVMDRAVMAAREVAAAAINAFDAQVRAHNLQLDQYKTDATVFESRIRASLMSLEKYKAMLEGAKIRGELRGQDVELYTAQLKGVMAVIDIYKSEMEGARIKSEVQVQKLTAYRSSVEAYSSRVNANVARYNAYSAKLAGEKAKADIYESQVRAYETRVKAVASQADAEAARAKALADANRSAVEAYQGDIQRYKADIELAIKAQESVVGLYRGEVEAFGQKVRAVDSHNDTQFKKFSSQVDKYFRHAQMVLVETDQELKRRIAVAQAAAENSKAGATINAQVVAALIQQGNYSVRIGYDESVTNTASEQASISTSV